MDEHAANAPRSPAPFEDELPRLRRDLERAVATICPPHLADRREDLVQEAMLKLTRLLDRSESRVFNASYLWRTAYSGLIDELRRLRRRAEVAFDDAGPSDSLAANNPGPEATHRGGEIRRALSACLAGLVESRRLAVILHLQGEPPRDAASLLGWDRKRVHNLTFRGLRDLRRCLTTRGVTP